MTRTALHILIRTDRFDAQTRALLARIRAETDMPVSIVGDVTHGTFDTSDAQLLPLAPRRLAEWGWAHPPHDWAWLCGDACYYAAGQSGIDAERFCLLEKDVFPTKGAVAALVSFVRDSGLDAGAVQLNDSTEGRRYSAQLPQFGLSASLGCIFPVSFLRSDLVGPMHDFRRRTVASPGLRVNDEAVFAATVLPAGRNLRTADLAEVRPDLFPGDAFDTNPPQLQEHFDAASEAAAHFVHPSVTMEVLIERLASGHKAYGKRRLRRVLAQATPEQRALLEASLEVAEARKAARRDKRAT